MNKQEREQWQRARAWLPAEHADQWTEEVREVWLRMRKAHKVWQLTKTSPSDAKGSIRENGQRSLTWIPNDEYMRYQIAKEEWLLVEPAYINANRARKGEEDEE